MRGDADGLTPLVSLRRIFADDQVAFFRSREAGWGPRRPAKPAWANFSASDLPFGCELSRPIRASSSPRRPRPLVSWLSVSEAECGPCFPDPACLFHAGPGPP